MRLVYLLLTTTLLLFSCSSSSKPKSSPEALIGKWTMLGNLECPMEVTAFEVLSLDSVVMDTDTAKCTIDEKSISVTVDTDSTMVLDYSLKGDFLTLRIGKRFSLLLYKEGKNFPTVPQTAKTDLIGTWEKDNHSVTLSADGGFTMTSQEKATYQIVDEGVLQLERKEQDLYPTVILGQDLNDKSNYHEKKLNWIVPYRLVGDSLTLFYLGDEVTYGRVK